MEPEATEWRVDAEFIEVTGLRLIDVHLPNPTLADPLHRMGFFIPVVEAANHCDVG